MYRLLTPDGFIESKEKGRFGGHRKLKIYGRLNCPSALRHIANGVYVKHRVFFATEEDAELLGFRPCGVCMKDEYKSWKAHNAREAVN